MFLIFALLTGDSFVENLSCKGGKHFGRASSSRDTKGKSQKLFPFVESWLRGDILIIYSNTARL